MLELGLSRTSVTLKERSIGFATVPQAIIAWEYNSLLQQYILLHGSMRVAISFCCLTCFKGAESRKRLKTTEV